MIQLLLDAGADPAAQDGTSATPFNHLRRKSWIKCERFLAAMKALFER